MEIGLILLEVLTAAAVVFGAVVIFMLWSNAFLIEQVHNEGLIM